jgi:hypothetical protein
MKICAACSQELPKEKFSKKQWQAKQQRRCKECIADNREVNLEAPNDAPSSNTHDDSKAVSDEDLFKEPPPREECPICFLPRPLEDGESRYKSCCGKIICGGCIYAVNIAGRDERDLCPFCRTPPATSEREIIERLKERVAAGDAISMRNLGCHYHRAGELGDAIAYNNIGYAYHNGTGSSQLWEGVYSDGTALVLSSTMQATLIER